MTIRPYLLLAPGRGAGSSTVPGGTDTTPGGGSSEVDAEYAAFTGTPSVPAEAGTMVNGQSNAGFFLDDALALLDQGLGALMGRPAGTWNPGAFGITEVASFGLREGLIPNAFAPAPYNTGDAKLSTYGGMPLYNTGGAPNDPTFPFLNSASTGDPATWTPGFCGLAVQRLIATLSGQDRQDCLGVLILHSEEDSRLNHPLNEYKAARLNWAARLRSWFARPATGPNGLPMLWVAPHWYAGGSGNAGHLTIRRAIWEIAQDPANNTHIVCWQSADTTTRDSGDHRDAASLQRLARRAAFGIIRVANSQRGIGSRTFPSFGPKVVWAYARSATQTDVTVAHDRGDALRLGSTAADGRGWLVDDNGTNRAVSGCAVVDARTLRLTHAACTAAATARKLTYCDLNAETGTDGCVYDNFASKPNPAGWPAGLDASWKFDFPLRSTFVPFACSGSPYSAPPASTGTRVLIDGADEKVLATLPFPAGNVGTLSLSRNSPAATMTIASNPGGFWSVLGAQLRTTRQVLASEAGSYDIGFSGLDSAGQAYSDSARVTFRAAASAAAHTISYFRNTTPIQPWGSFGTVGVTGTAATMANLSLVSGAPDWLFLSNTFELASTRELLDADAGTWQLALRSNMSDGSVLQSTVAMTITAPAASGDFTPQSIALGSGGDVLALWISQDPYQGSAQYTVAVDGTQVGGTLTASALHSAGQHDTVVLRGGWGAGVHTLTVNFLNDDWGGTAATDRNLYVEQVTWTPSGSAPQAVPGTPVGLAISGPATLSFGSAVAGGGGGGGGGGGTGSPVLINGAESTTLSPLPFGAYGDVGTLSLASGGTAANWVMFGNPGGFWNIQNSTHLTVTRQVTSADAGSYDVGVGAFDGGGSLIVSGTVTVIV